MLLKIAVVFLLLIIIYCLGSGLFYMLKDDVDSKRMVKALTWRISLSFALFIFLFICYAFGWVTPHGVA